MALNQQQRGVNRQTASTQQVPGVNADLIKIELESSVRSVSDGATVESNDFWQQC